MNFVALKMLTGDKAKYLGLIFTIAFCTFLLENQTSIFAGIMKRTGHQILDVTDAEIRVMKVNSAMLDDASRVDEHEAWRVRPDARASAAVRGYANLKAPLAFVRFEPFVVPKNSLTGDSTERVDTRVLQVIYRVEGDIVPLFVGLQMDVFIEGLDSTPAMTMK
jgi:hypothetical protein